MLQQAGESSGEEFWNAIAGWSRPHPNIAVGNLHTKRLILDLLAHPSRHEVGLRASDTAFWYFDALFFRLFVGVSAAAITPRV